MFSLTTFLVTSTGTPANGVMSIYDENNTLVSRESSVDGVVRSDILNTGVYVFRVASDTYTFPTRSLTIDEDGEGEVTLTALSIPSRTPLGAAWCSVEGTLRTSVGEHPRLCFSVSLLSGDYRAGANTIINQPALVTLGDGGALSMQLLRGRAYSITFTEVLHDAPKTCTIYVPDQENADIYDLLYPYAIAGFTDQPFTGDGDYRLSVLLSDGRHLTTYGDVSLYIYLVEADNAEVELIESEDDRAVLRVSGQPGSVVRVQGNRRGDLSDGPEDTLRVPGNVFLTLVS